MFKKEELFLPFCPYFSMPALSCSLDFSSQIKFIRDWGSIHMPFKHKGAGGCYAWWNQRWSTHDLREGNKDFVLWIIVRQTREFSFLSEKMTVLPK